MPTAKMQEKIWGTRARDWADVQEGVAIPLYEEVLRKTRTGAGGAALDIGCGSGIFCTLAQLVEALELTGLSVKGNEDNVTGSLAGRVRKGILKKAESDRIISNYLYLLNLAVYLKPSSIFSS